jgi:hypothetical protein
VRPAEAEEKVMSNESHPGESTPPIEPEARAQIGVPFGPTFFLTHLAAFVRDCCPTDAEELPCVHVHLAGGEVLELCHVIALAQRWVALAVFEDDASEGSRPMRTEIVPYELLVQITLRACRAHGAHIGFHQGSPPLVHTAPEDALELAAALRTRRPADSAGASP